MAIYDDATTARQAGEGRRYDLDWLRIIAFALLIFYHLGMFYVTWGWHVKSVYAGPAAEPAMLVVNPWRLSLLFFISGVAIRFATDKAPSVGGFTLSRLARLGLPILAGMIVIVAPQAYFELRQDDAIAPGYLAFWRAYLHPEQQFDIITPTWNHLWYLVYLLAYIFLIAPFLSILRGFANGRGGRFLAWVSASPLRLIALPAIPFALYALFLAPLYPTTHTLWGDWANHADRFTMFLLGYFAAKNAAFWRGIDKVWIGALALAVIIGALRLYLRAYHYDAYAALFTMPAAAPTMFTLTVYAWCCMLALFGAAQRWLNKPSPVLTYLTGAVFCFYILHQTIIVASGYYLTRAELGPWPEFAILSVITVAGCVAGYEMVRRIPVVRIFFGVKA